MLLDDATDSVVHWVDVVAIGSDDINCGVAWIRNQSVAGTACESAVLLKYTKLSRQYEWHTHL